MNVLERVNKYLQEKEGKDIKFHCNECGYDWTEKNVIDIDSVVCPKCGSKDLKVIGK